MSNEKSYNKITISIATALMVAVTISVGFQVAQPAMAQNMTEEAGQATENMTGQATENMTEQATEEAERAGNQTGNETGGPLDFLSDIFGGN